MRGKWIMKWGRENSTVYEVTKWRVLFTCPWINDLRD